MSLPDGGRPPQPSPKTARPVGQTGEVADVHGAQVTFGYDHDAVYIAFPAGQRHLFGMNEILQVVMAIVKANNHACEYERGMRAPRPVIEIS